MPSIHGILRRTYNGLNKVIARRLLRQFATFRQEGLQLDGLGRGDGTWVVPANLIQKDAVCYCVGVGDDATFDMALADRGARVFSFDPTPRAIRYMQNLDFNHERITFMPLGIWNENKKLKFFAPMNRDHVNLSVRDIHGTGEYFEVDCRRLRDVMGEFGHDHLDLLKLDIEGAWFEVLQDVVKERIPVSILCVEFDSPTSLVKSLRIIRELKKIGLQLVHQDRDNFLFLKDDLINGAA
jgi:FkbM family methyltransferase